MAQQHLEPTDPTAGLVTGEALAGYLRAQATEFLRALRQHRETGGTTSAHGTEGPVDAARALRRSARRISGNLHTFRPLLDPDWSERIRPELAWVSGTLASEHACEARLERLLLALHRLSGATVFPAQGAGVASSGRAGAATSRASVGRADTATSTAGAGSTAGASSTGSAANTGSTSGAGGAAGAAGAASASGAAGGRNAAGAGSAPGAGGAAGAAGTSGAGSTAGRADAAGTGDPADAAGPAGAAGTGGAGGRAGTADRTGAGGATGVTDTAAASSTASATGAAAAGGTAARGLAGATGAAAAAGRADAAAVAAGPRAVRATPAPKKAAPAGAGPAAHSTPGPDRGNLTVGAAKAGALLDRQLTLARTRAHSTALQALGSSRFHAVADNIAVLASEVPLTPTAVTADLRPYAHAAEDRLKDAVAALPLVTAGHPYNAEALIHGLSPDPSPHPQDAPWHQVRLLLRLHRYAREVLYGETVDVRLLAAGEALDRHRDASEAAAAAAQAARTPRIAPATAYALGVLHADQRHEVEAARFAFQRAWQMEPVSTP